MKIDKETLAKVVDEFIHEVNDFGYELSTRCQRDNQVNGRGAFTDLEGIVLYSLIRKYRPNLIFEISPDTGMSTNYILQAVKKNDHGKVIGFELEEEKRNYTLKPTIDVIKENQVDPSLVDKFYTLVLGNATETCRLDTYGKPDLILIDSCHEDWFAKWYLSYLLPNVRLFSLIQDISYEHRIEDSTEAELVRDAIEKNNTNFILVDSLRGYLTHVFERMPIKNILTNSILIGGKDTEFISTASIAGIGLYNSSLKDPSILQDPNKRAHLLNTSFPGGKSQFATRYLSLCLSYEKNKFVCKSIKHDFLGALRMSSTFQKDLQMQIFLGVWCHLPLH